MKNFYELTARGRALRLRRVALSALECYDLDVRRMSLLTNGTNCIFRIDTQGGKKFALRVCLAGAIAHSLEQIRSEMMWLDALGRETDLLIPAPLLTRDGALMTTVEAPGVPEPRHVMIFSWIPGGDIAEQLTLENVARYGAFAAQLHMHGAAFQPPPDFSIVSYDRTFYFQEPELLLKAERPDIISPDCHAVFQVATDRVRLAIESLKASGEPLRVLHGDLHIWNVKAYRGQVGAFDFEDLTLGWPVQDIAITLYYLHGRENYPQLLEAFRRGYTTHAPWPERESGEIDTFIVGRALTLANTLLNDHTPEWQAIIPDFMIRSERRIEALLDNKEFSYDN